MVITAIALQDINKLKKNKEKLIKKRKLIKFNTIIQQAAKKFKH